MDGSRWIAFYMKDNKSFYFDSFGGPHVEFNQLPKPIFYHNYKIQDINSSLRGTFCLDIFYLIERMDYYDAELKIYFSKLNADKCFWQHIRKYWK